MIDVCLLLEGSYPYVAGGVSTWVHQLISAMTDIRFGIVTISPHADPTRQAKYELPPHVLYLREIFLHDYQLANTRPRNPRPADFAQLATSYTSLLGGQSAEFATLVSMLQGPTACFDVPSIFQARAMWQLLTTLYEQHAPQISFLDFFWTWRSTHLPLVHIAQTQLPRAKIYHAISTGYAGLLGAIARVQQPAKFFLTEHGIYTFERLLEISQAQWIYEATQRDWRAPRELSFFKRWWVQMFSIMSRLAYTHADQIFTLYEGNRTRQILEGADPHKISIIPNGLNLADFQAIQRSRRATPHIGLIGRVVSIKDVKTFIQAARQVLITMPEAHFYVIGPLDEETNYCAECRQLVDALGLESQLTFTDRVDPKVYYQFLDVVVLTSLSEAQPYVILEANVVGIPVVATDVGACRELLEGRDAADRALGASGLLTEVANPHATAAAIVELLANTSRYAQHSHAGRTRVARYYNQDDLLSRYLNAYEQNV